MEQVRSVPVAYKVASLLLQHKGELLLTCPFTQEPGWQLPSCEYTNESPEVVIAQLAAREFRLCLPPQGFDLVHTSHQIEQGMVGVHLFFSVRRWEGYPILLSLGMGHARWVAMEELSEILPLNIALAVQALDEGRSYSEIALGPSLRAVLRLVE